MKHISSLVKDINEVIKGKGGWDNTINEYFKETIGEAAMRRLSPSDEKRPKTLRMSNIGSPCRRKLWYYINLPEHESDLSPSTLTKFFFGDILESLLLSLAKAAGHTVSGEQDTMTLNGIVGHRDAVIDGVTVDVKSASTMGFKKFKNNELRINDPFGYIRQLTAYVKAAENDPLVTDKTGGAFLVIDKQHGHIHLDYYDLEPELHMIKREVDIVKTVVRLPTPYVREFEEVPEGKSGNMKLPAACSYCDYKHTCWPGLRTFIYSTGPTYLTKVVKTPNVPEVT